MNITWHKIGKGKKLHANPNIGNLQYALCHKGPLGEVIEFTSVFSSLKCCNCIREIVKLREQGRRDK